MSRRVFCVLNVCLNALCWRRATLAFRLPSPLEGLTAVFGMRTGVPPPIKHQHRAFNAPKKIRTKKENQYTRLSLSVTRGIACVGFCRRISTPRLNALLHVHLVPINVVISHGSQTIPNLGVGFPLRCFQRLSFPDIATGRCHWRDSPQTRGQFISVLSY